MAGTRSTKTKNQTRSTKGRTQKKKGRAVQEPSFIRSEVVIILTFAVSVLLLLSNFHLCGVVGDVLRGFMLGLFGWMGILVIPVFLCVAVCFQMANRGNVRLLLKLCAIGACIWIVCGVFQMAVGLSPAEDGGLIGFYRASGRNGGGGLFGAMLAWGLTSLLGKAGAWLMMAVALAIDLVYITEKSLVGLISRGSGKAYRYAREDIGRRRILHEERKEERRRLREEQVVRGVNLASTKIDGAGMEPPSGPEDSIAGLDSAIGRFSELGEPDGPDADFPPSDPDSQAEGPIGVPDAFVGSIQYPRDYEEDDTVPFELSESAAADSGCPGSSAAGSESPGSAGGFGFPVYSAMDSGLDDAGADAKAVTALTAGAFEIPEEPKQVVTASGKIIDTDTEALKKKLESRRAQREEDGELTVREEIEKREEEVRREYVFPTLDLLKKPRRGNGGFSEKEYRDTAVKLQQTLQNFGVGVTVTNISCGPSVTRYELHPEQGVKVSRIVSLADDIKLNLAAADIRIEAPIPGKAAVGIEVPNKENNTVYLRELLESDGFKKHSSRIAFAVGKDIGGQVVVTDIAKMPHLLIAGATGSGKSVCINTLIMSILYKAKPEDVKLIMVDPKVVELSVYNGIPHLLIPVVTDPKKAAGALNWAVAEMTDRYKKFADYNVRDLKGYNEKVQAIEAVEDPDKPQKLPQIVIIVDELADLMMVAPGEVEDSICRLAQLARAAGIHLVIATQRPSVNVITGLIKANVPSRIAFAVSSGVDSRTIIDMNGAEKLLGKGDMLFYPAGFPKPQRVQGAFVSDQEVQHVVEFLRDQGMQPAYQADIEDRIAASPMAEAAAASDGRDEYFQQAGRFIIEKEKASIGMLQRMFKIGFNRAARIMDQLADAGVVGEEEGTKPRKVLMTMEEFDAAMSGGNADGG